MEEALPDWMRGTHTYTTKVSIVIFRLLGHPPQQRAVRCPRYKLDSIEHIQVFRMLNCGHVGCDCNTRKLRVRRYFIMDQDQKVVTEKVEYLES